MIEWVRRNFNESGAESEDGWTFDESYTIKTTIVAVDAYAVMDAANLPKVGDTHRSGKATCTNRAGDHLDGGPLVWEVVISYAKTGNEQPPGGGEDPTINRPTLTVGATTSVVTVTHDKHGVPIVNSAGEAFADGYQVERSHMTITLAKQIDFGPLTPAVINTYKDMVHGPDVGAHFTVNPLNITAQLGPGVPLFFGFGNWVVKFADFGASTVAAGNDTKWQAQLRFNLADSWLGTALDQGIYENFNSQQALSPGALANMALENRKPIIDFMGLPVSKPVLLDGAGKRLKTGQPRYRVFQVHPHGNLNLLLQALTFPLNWSDYRIILT
jgi:hypothetical protein